MGFLNVVGRFAATQVLRTAAGLLATPDDLHILAISLNVENDLPEVIFELEINPELRAASTRLIKKWTFPTSTLAIPNQLEPGEQGLGPPRPLPSDFVKELASHLPAAKGTPLWIKFGPLTGYLRLVPWDALLRAGLDHPILWLIDLESPPPRELDTRLDVVLCASEPRVKSQFSEAHVQTIARSILAANARQEVVIHVFADGARYEELSAGLKDLGECVRLYQPPESARNRAGTGDSVGGRALPAEITNAWLRWIAQSLDRPVDVVHFVCHGYLTSEQGWLALAETPSKNVDEEWSRFIGSADLDPFLVHVGAWSMIFSSPPGNFSPAGLRLLANQMCEDGCRSALLHDVSADIDGAQLTSAYTFLYRPGPNVAPAGAALSIYCHPSLVKVGTVASSLVRGVTRALPSQFGFTVPEDVTDAVATGLDDALRKFQQQGGVPPWLATTQRYVEQRKLELRRLERGVGSGSDEQRRQIEQAKAMLSAIEQASVGLANKSGGRS
jgi:hypothetical protein